MNTYLVTPKYVLGSDSFYVTAESHVKAIELAKARIKRENWYSPHGWEILLEVADFSCD